MWCVILQPKGTSRNAVIPPNTTTHSPAIVASILRRATVPELIGKYKWKDMVVYLYGYKTGKAGTENKHELPPPHDMVLLFGDAVMIAVKQNVLVSFSATDYTNFYNETLGGFEELGSEDSAASEDDEDDEEEDEEEEEEEEEAEDAEEEEEAVVIDEEEEEVAPRPAKIPKLKRNAKKIQSWYFLPELVPEAYDEPQIANDVVARKAVRLIIARRLQSLSEADRIDLERGIFNVALEEGKRRSVRRVWDNPEFQTVYDIVSRRTLSNLDGGSYIGNARLMERLRDGEFRPHDVACMTYSDLSPEKWGNLIEMSIKREAKMLEVDKSMATDMFRCSRCGKRQCTYYEMQTRSADEPMTQFIRCLNCGKQWRQ